jgi:hypothetical protein
MSQEFENALSNFTWHDRVGYRLGIIKKFGWPIALTALAVAATCYFFFPAAIAAHWALGGATLGTLLLGFVHWLSNVNVSLQTDAWERVGDTKPDNIDLPLFP